MTSPAEPTVEPPPERPRGGSPRARETVPVIAFVVAIVSGLFLLFVYVENWSAQWQGGVLALCLGGIGVGMVSWAKAYLPPGPETEPRERLESTPEEIDAFAADFRVGEVELERRGLLTKLLVGALAALGLGALVPVLSLGPNPNASFDETPYKKGRRILNEAGQPITRGSGGQPSEPQPDGIITVFPDGELDQEFAQTLLINLPEGFDFEVRSGRQGWDLEADDGTRLVAFSKVCTHAGCPVGLYEAQKGLLLCPCHQSTFDVHEACRPVFGPASTSLPQLPLAWNDEGELVADGDFSDPPGPGFWNQLKLWEDKH
jgi:ubiquinol-cytochrome c reductase iron-sulfur subunit